jgi:hypothetical protein
MPKDRSLPDISRAYGHSRWLRGYVSGKISWDPVYPLARREIIERHQPVIDIGCGIGLLGISMRAAGISLRYRGSDISAWKVNLGKEAVRYYGFEDAGFEVCDALSTTITPGATVCMIDVLHYLDTTDQQRMLHRLAEAAEDGSLVLIRTALRGMGWRYAATLIEEWWTRATGWIRGGRINFPTREEILGVFEGRGLHAEISPLWGKTPFASCLVKIQPRARCAAQPHRRAA